MLPSSGPNSPFSVGGRTLLARTCKACGELVDGASFPLLNKGRNEARRKVCHLCHNKRKKLDREQRGIGLPTPARPPEDLQTSKYKRWTKDEDAYLREHVAEGEYEAIARALGRSLDAVYQRRIILGLARVRPSNRVQAPWKIESQMVDQLP